MSHAAPAAQLLVAVPAALVAAAGFGLSGALQQRASTQTGARAALDLRLLGDLARHPLWLCGTGAVVLGAAGQLTALAFGPLALIQPLLTSGIVFGTVFSARLSHRRLDKPLLLGAAACTLGLAAFLSLARPSGGSGTLPTMSVWAPLAVVLAVLAGAAVVVAAIPHLSTTVHVSALAGATGLFYGTTAGLLKIVTTQIRGGGMPATLAQPTVYVTCLLAVIGFVLSQHTFKQDQLIAPALAVITTVDPLVGVLIGINWLGEHLVTTPPALAGQAGAVTALIAGIVLLARRAAQIRHRAAQAGTQPENAEADPGSPPTGG